jgi:dihydrodipicolinate synthase/N-acetylneuraminate lyase
MSRLQGIVPALVTPFEAEGHIDEASLQRAVRHQIAEGADGLLILGLAGEGIYLSVEERERVVTVVFETAGDDVPILVGCTADTTDDACRLVAGASRAGAAGVMVAPPRKPEWSIDQLRAHYRAVAAAADCEVMVQDAPFAVGVTLGVEFVLELARELDNVRAYKIEKLPYWPDALRARSVAGDTLRVFGGHGGLYLLDVLDSGAVGLIPGSDLTRALSTAWIAYQHGDRATAQAWYARMLPLLVFQAQSLGLLVGGAKLILRERGVIETLHARLPEANLDASTAQRTLDLARDADLV